MVESVMTHLDLSFKEYQCFRDDYMITSLIILIMCKKSWTVDIENRMGCSTSDYSTTLFAVTYAFPGRSNVLPVIVIDESQCTCGNSW